MPTVQGRWVPDHHAAAVAARRRQDEADTPEDEVPEKPAKKRATRTRKGKKADTAMVEDTETEAR